MAIPSPYGSLGPAPDPTWKQALNMRSVGMNKAYGLPKKAPQKLPKTKPQGMSAEAWARMKAQEYVDSLIAGVNAQRDAYLAEQRRNSDLEISRGQELAAALKQLNLGGSIQDIYSKAAGEQAGLAQGFSGALRDSAAAGAAEQARMVSGLGQDAGIRDQGENMGNATYGIGGLIPGLSLGQQGAAFAADAALQPGYALRQGYDKAADVYREGLGGLDQFAAQIADAQGQRFGVEQDLLKQRQAEMDDQTQNRLAQQKLQLQAISDNRNYWLKQQALYLSQGKYELAKQAEKRAQAAERRYQNATMGLDAQGNVAPGYMRLPGGTIVKRSEYVTSQAKKGLDVNGNVLPGFRRTKTGAIVKVGTSKSGATLTPGQVQDSVKAALGYEKDIVKTDLPQLAKQTGLTALKPDNPKYKSEVARLKKSLTRALWVRYAPRATSPAAKKAMRSMINRIVRTYDPAATGSGSGLTDGLLD